MNLFTGERSDAYFGGDVPPATRQLLRQAAEAPADQRGALLWTAQAMAPSCLPIYYALYKHHAGRREFELAERAARRALAEAGAQAGLPEDWHAAVPEEGRDFQVDGPARFWLFTLKALAFICLRSGRPAESQVLLATIERLDPGARIGSDVTSSLLASSQAQHQAHHQAHHPAQPPAHDQATSATSASSETPPRAD